MGTKPYVRVDSRGMSAWPARYYARKTLKIYEETGNFSLMALRDGKLWHKGSFSEKDEFTLYEVRQGTQYGICFGRVLYKSKENFWVQLGLDVSSSKADFT